MKYQNDFSKINNSVLDIKLRTLKAEKILSVLKDYFNTEKRSMKNMVCLDIGGSAGFSAKVLSPYVKKIYIIDIDKNALEFGKKTNSAENIIYKVDDGINLSFKDNSFDIIICNQVYEHVPDHNKLFSEIYRVLKQDGVCYFGAGNKYRFVEQHYRLPFLSWIPKRFANFYLKSLRGIELYYETHLSYFGLRQLINNFKVKDYTVEIIKNPKKFHATDMISQNSYISKTPKIFLNIIKPVLPGYVFILSK